MRVEASIPNLRVSPEISADPVKRLHEAFPAALPASGNASVAFTFGNAGVPAKSCSTHSVPVSDAGAEFGVDGFFVGLCVEGHPVARKARNAIPARDLALLKGSSCA